MPNSGHWSNNCAPCRIEWRPSRLFAASLVVLGALGAASSLMSEAPAMLGEAMALASLAVGTWQAHREASRPRLQLAWSGRGLEVDGRAVVDPRLAWRGSLAFLHWRDSDGRQRRAAWWPDTLDAPDRRELRLAAGTASPVHPARSMAP